MRTMIVAVLVASSTVFAGDRRAADACVARCSDKLNTCVSKCKNVACNDRCADQIQTCTDGCEGLDFAGKEKAPKGTPGRAPKGHRP